MNIRSFSSFLVVAAIFSAAVMSSCGKDGEDGKDGAKGDKGDQGEQGEQGVPGASGADGTVVTVGEDGFWYIDNQKTDYKAIGTDGVDGTPGTPGTVVTIIDGYWAFDGVKSEHKAIGEDGKDGGGSNLKIEVSDDGYWIINGEKTDIKITGEVGSQVEVKADGFLWINGVKTEIQVHECVKTFTITFLLNDFDTEPYLTQTLVAGGWAREPSKAPTKEKAVFEFWYNANENIVEPFDFDTPVTDDITVVAKWHGIFSVTFDSNGGSEVAPQTVDEGDKAVKPSPDPTKVGYTFEGWFTDNNTFADEWDFDENTVTDDVALFAKWVGAVLKNTSQPFATIGEVYSNPADWWRAADWTVSDNLIENGSVSGGWRNFVLGVMAFPGNTPLRQIINGKIYQTVALEAGSYKFDAVIYGAAGEIQVYVAAALGVGLPDTNDVPLEALAHASVTAGASGTVSVVFTLDEETVVSLGFVGDFNLSDSVTANNVFFSSFTLLKD